MRCALLLLAACATRATTANPSELAVHARAFVHDGRAELIRDNGNVTVDAATRVDVRVREGDLQRTATVTVRELVTGCERPGAGATCLAHRTVEEPLLVHRERRFDSSRTATLAGVAGIGGIVAFCAAECRSGGLERGFLYSGAVVGGIVVLGVLMMFLGH